MDDRMRRLGHAARTEAQSGIDVDAALEATLAATSALVPDDGEADQRAVPTWAWLTTAAALMAIVAGGALLISDRSDSIRSADEHAVDGGPAVGQPSVSLAPTSTTTEPTLPASVDTTTPVAPVDPGTTTTTTPTAPSTTHLPTALPWSDFEWEGSPIARSCMPDIQCTQLRIAPDGTTVSYDPVTRELTRHAIPELSTVLPESYGAVWIELIGPDHVAYLNVDPLVADGDGIGADLVAVSLASPNVGQEMRRWAGVTSRIGDIDLVATREGIVWVGCCGPDTVRPDPVAEVMAPWIGRDGGDTLLAGPDISVTLDHPRTTFHRDDLSWTIESPDGGRGMPPVVPTFDGGVIAILDGQDGNTTIVRGWADGTVEQVRLDALDGRIAAAEPTGVVVIEDGERFARVRLFDDRAPYWTGTRDIDAGGTGRLDLPGLNDEIAATKPAWAFDPVTFAQAVIGPTTVNETRAIESTQTSELTWTVVVATGNVFDDSMSASRHELLLNRSDEGHIVLEGGTWSQVCQPGRGQQEFSPQLCI